MDALIRVLVTLLNLYSFVLLARVLMSWLNVDPSSQIAQILYDLTEPILAPIRSFMPQTGMVDFSPMIAFLLIIVLQQVLRSFLFM